MTKEILATYISLSFLETQLDTIIEFYEKEYMEKKQEFIEKEQFDETSFSEIIKKILKLYKQDPETAKAITLEKLKSGDLECPNIILKPYNEKIKKEKHGEFKNSTDYEDLNRGSTIFDNEKFQNSVLINFIESIKVKKEILNNNAYALIYLDGDNLCIGIDFGNGKGVEFLPIYIPKKISNEINYEPNLLVKEIISYKDEKSKGVFITKYNNSEKNPDTKLPDFHIGDTEGFLKYNKKATNYYEYLGYLIGNFINNSDNGEQIRYLLAHNEQFDDIEKNLENLNKGLNKTVFHGKYKINNEHEKFKIGKIKNPKNIKILKNIKKYKNDKKEHKILFYKILEDEILNKDVIDSTKENYKAIYSNGKLFIYKYKINEDYSVDIINNKVSRFPEEIDKIYYDRKYNRKKIVEETLKKIKRPVKLCNLSFTSIDNKYSSIFESNDLKIYKADIAKCYLTKKNDIFDKYIYGKFNVINFYLKLENKYITRKLILKDDALEIKEINTGLDPERSTYFNSNEFYIKIVSDSEKEFQKFYEEKNLFSESLSTESILKIIFEGLIKLKES